MSTTITEEVPASISAHTSGDTDLAFIKDETSSLPKFSDPDEKRKYLKHYLVLAFH